MKKIIKSISVLTLTVFIIISACFSASSEVSDNAETTAIAVGSKQYNVLTDNIYGCYETFEGLVSELDISQEMEIDYTDSVWYQTVQIENWWHFTDYYYRHCGPVKDNYFSMHHYTTRATDPETGTTMTLFDDYRSSVQMDVKEKRIAVSANPNWQHEGDARVVFVAPYQGKIVLWDEAGKFIAADSGYPFNAFEKDNTLDICIMKNDVKIWPEGDAYATISKKNRTYDFPDLGELLVNAGDEIELHFYTRNTNNENSTVFVDPMVAYTYIVPGQITEEDDNAGDMPTYYDPNGNEDEGGELVIYIVIATIAVVVITAVIVIIMVFAKKKKPKLNSDGNAENFSE